jgi:glycosyltransferase involved in cell wall biosynthesis
MLIVKPPIITVIIPVYGEGSHLAESLFKIDSIMKSLDETYEIIVIDDGSPDNSWEIVKSGQSNFPFLRAVRFSRNFGKEAAIFAGLELARGNAITVIDADLQHPPELIPKMVRLWQQGKYDVVDAVKTKRGKESPIRRVGSAIFSSLQKKLSGYDLGDSTDFKLMDRKVVNSLLKMKEYHTFFRGMMEWIGFRHERILFETSERAGGNSSWSLLNLLHFALTALTSFSFLPLRLVTLFGVFFLICAFALAVWTLFNWFIGKALSGFTTVILLQLIIGSLTLCSLGIIGEYLARTYGETKKRPRYVIQESLNAINNPEREEE